MLILGAISGIQDFVFAVPEDEGGQARMLRARSFFVQALTEVVTFRIQKALGLGPETLLFCAAGRFALDATAVSDANALLQETRESLEKWLLHETAGALRLAVVADSRVGGSTNGGDVADHYEHAVSKLVVEKHHSWAPYLAPTNSWIPRRFVLPAIPGADVPARFRAIGKALPKAQWLLVEEPDAREQPTGGVSFELAGLRATLLERATPDRVQRAALAAALGGGPSPVPSPANRIRRPLARYVPLNSDGTPTWFEELAVRARGAPFLGLLKMDADSLGTAFRERLRRESDLRSLSRFSSALDDFFAVELDRTLRTQSWGAIYTVFSGGDDLLLVGPWDLMLTFAGHAQRLFSRRFRDHGLTISGGLAIVKYRYPIRHALGQADDLLHLAKTEPAPEEATPKDQIAALGQIWKWRHHETIIESARRLTSWVEGGYVRRGWLTTMLRFSLMAQGRPGEVTGDVTPSWMARLVYHVNRNWPHADDRDPIRRAIGVWVQRIVEGLTSYPGSGDIEVRYLPAILRYALLATRSEPQESQR